MKLLMSLKLQTLQRCTQMQDQTLTKVYLRKGALHIHESDQVVVVSRPLREGLLVCGVTACQYMSEGHLRVSANHWWGLLEKVE